MFQWPVGYAGGVTIPPNPSKIYCDAQGKGRGKGCLRKVTQRSFIDGGWWMVDILSLMLYTKFGCHPPPPYIRLLNQTFQNPPPQFLSLFLWPVGGAGGDNVPPNPSKIYCDAQAKVQAKGWPLKGL